MSESKRPWCWDESGNIYSGPDANGVGKHLFAPLDVSYKEVVMVVRSVNSRDLAVEAMEGLLRRLRFYRSTDADEAAIEAGRTALAAMKGEAMSDKLSRLEERLSDLADHVEAIEIDRKQGRDSLEFDERTRAWAATILRTLAPVLAKCEVAMHESEVMLRGLLAIAPQKSIVEAVLAEHQAALAALREVGHE